MTITIAQPPWPEKEELLSSFGVSQPLGGTTNSGPGAPARKSLQPSPSSNLREGAWAQQGSPASRGATGTGLPSGAPRMPRVSQPLRVEPPAEYNAPRRVNNTGKRAQPRAHRADQLKDYSVLASACRRAGKPGNAAQLMFNRGVLHDNMGEAGPALKCYKDLLRVSLETGDVVGEALACNCIGVTLQNQGTAKLEEALKYHQQHLAVADVPGKFIAHSNLGLAYQVHAPKRPRQAAPPPCRPAHPPSSALDPTGRLGRGRRWATWRKRRPTTSRPCATPSA